MYIQRARGSKMKTFTYRPKNGAIYKCCENNTKINILNYAKYMTD